MQKYIVIISLILLVASCNANFMNNADKYYLFSANGRNLVVSPPLTNSNISHFYDLPQQNKQLYTDIKPPKIKSKVSSS